MGAKEDKLQILIGHDTAWPWMADCEDVLAQACGEASTSLDSSEPVAWSCIETGEVLWRGTHYVICPKSGCRL